MIIDNDHERIGRWICERAGGTFTIEDSVCIGQEKDGQLVAGVLYNMYNHRSICVHVACEGQFSKEFVWYAFYYPFEQLGVNVILAMMDSENKKAIRLNLKLGFKIEHVIRNAGRKGDIVVTSMTRQECKYLKMHSMGNNHGQIIRARCA